jgi:hypothetical protein
MTYQPRRKASSLACRASSLGIPTPPPPLAGLSSAAREEPGGPVCSPTATGRRLLVGGDEIARPVGASVSLDNGIRYYGSGHEG